MNKTVLLLNPNLMRPPIAPLGLECLVPGLYAHGYRPVLCDLAFSSDWRVDLKEALASERHVAVAVTVRNLDDAYFASQDFILEKTAEVLAQVRDHTEAPIILGGVGFSIAPAEVLEYTGADYGIAGDGEEALPALLQVIEHAGEVLDIPGVVARDASGRIRQNGWAAWDLAQAAPLPRRFLDHPRYFREGGQAGFETKRGCAHGCIYCIEPAAKGRVLRLRAPEAVAAECKDLLDQGVDVFHTCDSEFNLPPDHARGVCEALCGAGLSPHIRWYAYAYPQHFDMDLAKAMVRAGCVGINFGVDHASVDQLRRLGRHYGPEDIRHTLEACRHAGLAVMFDMLLGGPGETRESLRTAIEFMRELDVDRAGLSCGVRVYPNTPLAAVVRKQGPLDANPHLHGHTRDNDTLLRPIFYVDAGLDGDIHDLVSELVDGDPRFLHANPNQLDGNYNYNDNSKLAQAIRDGARGAYWDILRGI